MTSSRKGGLTEDELVEQPAIEYFAGLGWETANCWNEFAQPGGSPLGRETKSEVVLPTRLRAALERLNPDLPGEALELAAEELTRERGAMSLARANREIYELLKEGVEVSLPDREHGGQTTETVRVVDWDRPSANDFFLASQFQVSGDMSDHRADLVGFVNGLPLVFVELKAVHERLETAYDKNLTEYKHHIPQLFWYNAFILLSNGLRSKVGSLTADWGHFSEWKKIDREGETGKVSLETTIRATCEPARLLDLVENYTLFMEARGGLAKLVAKNHQYLGVENAIASLGRERDQDESGLGVFWHTQGSGKSVSMVFFCQKVLRKIAGNWTFVVLTDRIDLDDQIYKNFARSGAVTEKQAKARNSKHLRQLLREDHRYVFTLIQKFGTPKGVVHEVLSTRSDVVVITDEAHRSQYDTLAMNLRLALPNARFLAFTGTPLIAGEEKTREVFGDYVSIYNFKQSIDDKATVPLFYENRIPELQLTNEHFDEDLERLLEEAEIDATQEERLEREFSRQYHLITREDRLERIAEDLVDHFLGRGFRGKAMAVAIDKATAVKMYDKVQKYWLVALRKLRLDLQSAPPERALSLQQKLAWVEETEMAVVVSGEAGEKAKMLKKGVDIVPHRQLMEKEDLDTRFKDSDDPFRLVFVCAMWLTGFDAPSCSTIYLDRPMRNHTLMQTIARANRVFPEKENGLIVDYVGVFADLQKALAIYGSDPGGGLRQGELPVRDKQHLVRELETALGELDAFLATFGVDLAAFESSHGRHKLELLGAIDAVLAKPERKRRFLALARHVQRRFKAVLPDPIASELAPRCALVDRMVQAIRAASPKVDVYEIMGEVATLLDDSVAAEGYVIREHLGEPIDLSKIDFDELHKRFVQGRKHIEAERLKGAVERKLGQMIRKNPTRKGFGERLEQMIDAYNRGAITVDELFRRLTQFAAELGDEDRRAIREGLGDDEELALFDLLTRPDMTLTEEEEEQVKNAARGLLATLKKEKLVIDWRKRQQSRAQVRVAIDDVLDQALPEPYTTEIYEAKCALVYQHVYDSYYGAGQSVYGAVA